MNVNEEITNAKLITPLRNGGFDDCAVSGERYEGQNGTRFWQITIVSADNFRPVSKRVNAQCLVFGEDFHCTSIETPTPLDIRRGKATEIDDEVKQGVLSVIRRWENEAPNS
jgi:hypothetical protein